MTVVSNTSPLNYLVLIRVVDLLPHLFGSVFIPSAVRDELSDPDAPEAVRRWVAHPPGWLGVEPIEPGSDSALNALHRGEREAILLAEKLQADLILLDEQAARSVATQRGSHVAGTLGVLNTGGARGLVDVPEAADRLRQTTFRATPSLYK